MHEHPERTETIFVEQELDKSKADRFREEIALFCDPPPIEEGDTLKIAYRISIAYFGQIVERLEAMLKMAQAGVITKMDYVELEHGRSLVLELGRLMEKLRGVQ